MELRKAWVALLLAVSVLLAGVAAYASPSQPEPGLLRWKWADSPGPYYGVTDGNTATYETLTGETIVWSFSRPVDLTGFYFYADSPDAQLYMIDEYGNTVAGAGASTTMPSASFAVDVKKVRSLRVLSANPNVPIRVYELDVYGSFTPIQPSVPSGVYATGSDGSVRIDWHPALYADGYHVKRSQSYYGPFSVVGTVYGGGANYFTDTNVVNGYGYYYTVSAFNAFGESPNSPIVYALPMQYPPNAPQHLVATPGDGQVLLQWDTVTSATYYRIKRSPVSGGPYVTVGSSVYAHYTDKTTVNSTYYYIVTAVNGAGESGWSNEASATPQPPEPDRALLVIMLTNGDIREYDLPLEEANGFATWYSNRSNGLGAPVYPLNRYDNNRGPFASRVDTIAFPSIVAFEVNAYASD